MSIDDERRPMYRAAAQRLSIVAQQAMANGARVTVITPADCALRGCASALPSAMSRARAKCRRNSAEATLGRSRVRP